MAAKKEGQKRVSPISRKDFHAKAPAVLPAKVADFVLSAVRKDFSTGSMGWNANGKVTLEVNGIPVECQVGLNVTVIGSADLPK